MGFVDTLGIEIVEASADRVEAVMPITPALAQPHGFVHGGVTLSLLETVASAGAELRFDPETELPFGIEVNVRHRKSAREGKLLGVAEIDHEEGAKQFWRVAAYDDAGDVVSDGIFVTKIVTLERLREKGVSV